MIRGEFWYEGLLETDLLRQAIQHITQAHPILHSAFRDKALRPYWEIMPYTIDDILTVIDADALTEQTEHELRIKAEEHGAEVEAESDRINRPAVGDVTDASDGAARLEQIRYDFMNQVIPVDHNVQYKVALINHRGKSLLCVLANHMVMDGRGGYSLFVQFAEAYSALKKERLCPS